MGRQIGGGRRAEFFSITIGTTQITLTSTTPVYVCTEQITSGLSKDDSGIPTWALDQVQADSLFDAFVETYAPPAGSGSSTPNDLLFEDGENQLGASASGTQLAYLIRGPLVTGGGTDAGKRCSYAGIGVLQRTSGSRTMAGNTFQQPSISVVGAALTLPLLLPSAVLTSFMVTPATTTIATSTAYGKYIYG